ncbi:MAG: hypothetical protein ACKOX6_00745 [Bdellovibrio sp.]
MNPAFNPQATFHACPDQNEFFVFMTKHGFAAIRFDLVHSFQSCSDNETLAQFGTNIFTVGDDTYFTAIESVPELVARYAEMQKRRNSAPAAVPAPGKLESVASSGVRWNKPQS